MMDTDALWQAISAYGNARWRGVKFEQDAADHLSDIKRLLNEADAERQELLAENERLVDEVGSLKAARIAYASEFPPIPDGDDAGLPDVGRIHENIRRLKAANPAAILELIAERDALKAELERIKALPPVAWRSSMGHGVTLRETISDDLKALTWAGKPMWQPLIALGSKT